VRLRKNAKRDLLATVPLFTECSKRELEEIAQIADELDLPSGTVLIREGERGREFFVLVEGSLSVSKNGRRVNSLDAGTWVGEMALLSDAPRNATVTATSPIHILVITDRAFQRLVKSSPSIALKVLASVSERLKPENA
jgi:CRP/FNR family cyclic AMP-dependent transcriptional regulator